MKQLSTYIGYIMGLAGFAGLIWTYASKSVEKDYNVADLKKDVVRIETNMATKSDMNQLRDTFNVFIIKSKETNQIVIGKVNAMQISWKMFLKDNVHNFDTLMRYLQGIEFEIVMTDRPDVKMRIEQIK